MGGAGQEDKENPSSFSSRPEMSIKSGIDRLYLGINGFVRLIDFVLLSILGSITPVFCDSTLDERPCPSAQRVLISCSCSGLNQD